MTDVFRMIHRQRVLNLMLIMILYTANNCSVIRIMTIVLLNYNPGQKYWDNFQNSTQNTSPNPMQCCHVAVFMYSPNDFSGFQHCLGEGGGGVPQICNDSTTKLMTNGYRYPEHKCTLQMLFSYMSQKILARIVDSSCFLVTARHT